MKARGIRYSAELKAHYETCDEPKATDLRHLKGMLLRSPFRLPCIRQNVESSRANGWARKPPLREGGFKQGRVVEKAF